MASAVFVSWVKHHGRSAALARALGAEPVFIAVGRTGQRVLAPIRYLVQTGLTTVMLVHRRPSAVIAMAPPNLLIRVLLVWRRLTGARLVIDAHSDAVLERQGSATRGSFLALARRADATIVTNEQLEDRLAGVRTFVLDNPPVAHPPGSPPPGAPPLVLFPASWGFDEPVDWVAAAAEQVPEARFAITGRPREERLPHPLPENLVLTGFLSTAEYEALLASATLVVALTTREETMQQAAYEALDFGKPVVASGTRALRGLLGGAAIYVDEGQDLGGAVGEALARHEDLAQEAARVQEARWRRHIEVAAGVKALLDGSG